MAQFVSPYRSAEAQLEALIQQRRQAPHRAAEIDAEIRNRFATTVAIMVLDMADFSRLTQTQGIISTLQDVYRLREIAIPILENQGGKVLKVEADNLYAVFADPDTALHAAHTLLMQLNEIDLHASIGIGYGEVLMVGDRDLYGNEMNLTSKLGEDLARDDEILLSEIAHRTLTYPHPWKFTAVNQEISDIPLTYYRLHPSHR